MVLEEYLKKVITQNLYLHFFNREIYRGIYGARIDRMQLDHSDILTTIMICGCNVLLGSYSAFHETIKMFSDKGKIYRELNNFGIIKISGETLNIDLNLGHKQEIYCHDRELYPGYFESWAIQDLENIVPDIIKPDVTDHIEMMFIRKDWEKITSYAPTLIDKKTIGENKQLLWEIVKHRENKAITKSIFCIDGISTNNMAVSVGRTLSGIYVKDYISFVNGDIITGIPGLGEYDFLAKDFPSYDYEILKELLQLLGFPKVFTLVELEKILKFYRSHEHMEFALRIQKLLHKLYDLSKFSKFEFPIDKKRLYFIPIIREKLCTLDCKEIDFESSNFYNQALENVTMALEILQQNEKKETEEMKSSKVFVVTGRDEDLRVSIFNMLRALKLEPMEWMDVLKSTGQPSAYIHDAIKKSINDAGAVVIIMAPEERAQLVEKFWSEAGDDREYFQPRPNVIFEAGLALGIKEEKTIILQFGDIRIFSDIFGKHIVKYKGKSRELEFKNDLFHKLQMAGCNCDAGNDYFNISINHK